MKRAMGAAALALALGAGLAGCERGADKSGETAAGPVEKPVRKAGLWEQTTTVQGSEPQVLRLCADQSVENTLPWWGRVAQVGSCQDVSGARGADGAYSFETKCDMGGAGKSTISGSGSGDFDSRYQVTIQMATTGASDPRLNGVRQISNAFEYKGECPADWSLGDVEVPGGMRMNYDPDQVQREIAKAQAALKAQEAAARASELEP